MTTSGGGVAVVVAYSGRDGSGGGPEVWLLVGSGLGTGGSGGCWGRAATWAVVALPHGAPPGAPCFYRRRSSGPAWTADHLAQEVRLYCVHFTHLPIARLVLFCT